MENVEGSKLVPHNEIVFADHRALIVDVNAEEHFNDNFSLRDQMNHVKLNPASRGHREKFYEKLEEQSNVHRIEDSLDQCQSPTHQQIEHIDHVMTKALNVATKKVERPKRNMPYSKEKVRRKGTLQCWRSHLRKLKGVRIDEGKMEKLGQVRLMIPNSDMNEIQVDKKHEEVRKSWEELRKKGKETREEEILDFSRAPIE